MAYHDASGRITIDEVAAQRDVRRMESTIEKLKESKKTLDNLITSASDMKGKNGIAIANGAMRLKRDLNGIIEGLETQITYINRTVAKYERIDRELKQTIESSDPRTGWANINPNSHLNSGGSNGRF